MYWTDVPKTWNDWWNWGDDNEKVVTNCSDNKQITTVVFSQNDFNTLSLWEQANYIRKLYYDSNFDAVKELVQNNERLRIAFHEAAHVVVWMVVWNGNIHFDSVAIRDYDYSRPIMYESIGESEWRVMWSNFFQIENDRQLVHIQLAWYVMEMGMWISNENASRHGSQDFQTIVDWQLFDYIYEEWLQPTHFDDSGRIKANICEPKLTKEQIMTIIMKKICTDELQTVAKILRDNRWWYYTIACALYEKWMLTYDEVEWLPSL